METIDVMAQDGSYDHPYLLGVRDVPGVSEHDECIVGSWVKCNTDMLMTLMSQGHELQVPDVSDLDLSGFGYSDDELTALANCVGDLNDIAKIEYVGDMEVQCIEVNDPDHMYMTDNFISFFNTSNIVFLKSTDDAMLDTLEKMSGKTHRTYAKSKSVTRDRGRLLFQNENQGNITYETVEEPVLNYNRFAFLGERQSIVFRASDPPVLNRNQMILPMSWRLFMNKINHPGHDYTLQTIPTLSSASEFDARKNLPRFEEMVDRRIRQAVEAEAAAKEYADAFGYDDYAVEQLDPDVYSDAVMDIINAKIAAADAEAANAANGKGSTSSSSVVTGGPSEVNEEGRNMARNARSTAEEYSRKIYAGGGISRSDLAQYDEGGKIINFNHALDSLLIDIFSNSRNDFASDRSHFSVKPDGLYDRTGRTAYITSMHIDSKGDDGRRTQNLVTYDVSDAFYEFLLRLGSWERLANGAIERGIIESQSS